jgi:hypothetical protein
MSTTRDKLSLSSDAASKKNKIPKLKEVELKVRFDISKETLLTYQHKHNTNTHFLPLKLKLDPTAWVDLNEIERHILVNCLNKDIRLSYNYPVNGHIIHEEFTDDLLLEELNDTAEDLLWEELQFASNIINITKNDFVPSVIDNTIKIVTNYLDNPAEQDIFPQTLIYQRGIQTYLDWRGSTDLAVSQIIKEQGDEALSFPFPKNEPLTSYSLCFIDLDKIPTLACLFGHVVMEEAHSSYQKDHSLIYIKGDGEFLYQNLVKALIEQTSHLLKNICQKPVGFLFEDSVSKCSDDFNTIKNNALDYINQAEKNHKKAKDKTGLEYAKTLIDFTNNQRLKLTLEQGFYWKPVYFEVLTETIKRDLFAHISDAFSKTCINNEEFYFEPYTECDFIYYSVSAERDPNSINFFEDVFTLENNTPSELALLLNASVKEFFVKHPLIGKLNIDQPKNKILIQTDVHDNVLIFDGEKMEFICIANYFTGQLIPRQSELILDVTRLKKQLCEGPAFPPDY